MKDLLSSLAAAFPLQETIEHLHQLTHWDRFQASDGIVRAADFVSDVLEVCGLTGIEVHHYRCPSRWWTFDGPVSWTPRHAALHADGSLIVRYPADALCLATHSAPASVSAPLKPFGRGNLSDAVLLYDGPNLEEATEIAEADGAAGIIANTVAGRLPEARGRFELPGCTRLFGFSVTAAEFARLQRAARVDVEVAIDKTAPMPLVEARIAGASAEAEVVIQAHLCHPRPGANDNASGVAAALGLAAALSTMKRPLRSIRFLFGPEFVGTAAYVHDFVDTARRPRPIAAVNLDMVAANKASCGGPLMIELPPDHVGSPLGPLAEHFVSLLPSEARTHSGALPACNWNSIVTPFAGRSDHAIYADRSIAIPAIMVGHWPDRFNHTSLDTPEKIDPAELRRAAALAGACAWTMGVADCRMHKELALVVFHHTCKRLLTAVASPYPDAELLNCVANCGKRQLAALEGITGERIDGAARAIDEEKNLLCRVHNLAARGQRCRSDLVVHRLWPGPFNVRGLLQSAEGTEIKRLRARVAADKSAYTTIFAIALAIDDHSSRTQVIERSHHASMIRIEPAFAHDVFEALLAASWVTERPRALD